jgi:thymidine kinase
MAYLEIIIGPMFAGKTSYLHNIYNTHHETSLITINHISDTRYSVDDAMFNHDGVSIPCVRTAVLGDVIVPDDTEVVLINECNFYPDLFEFVVHQVDVKKRKVYVCGLDGDFQRNMFGDILKLIPYCNKVIKLNGICQICGQSSIYSKRITNEKEQISIGTDNYLPVCRECYLL